MTAPEIPEVPEMASTPEVKEKPLWREVLEVVVIAVVLALVIRFFVVEPFYIPSESMLPTLEVNDRIIVSKVNYYFTSPERGEILVFKYPLDLSQNFVKRLIAVGGETVELKNSVLYINGEAVPEDYLPPDLRYSNFGPVEVPEGHFFMMGDNRNSSSDSRTWGYVDEELLIGRAMLIIWPFDRFGVVK